MKDVDPFIKQEKKMSVMTRIIRLWKADFNSLIDELEDKNLLIKQHLREMETEIYKNKSIMEAKEQEKKHLFEKQKRHDIELEELESDLQVAVVKNKENIIKMLIKKILTNKKMKNNLDKQIVNLKQETVQIQDKIKVQLVSFEHLKIKANLYLTKKSNPTDQHLWEDETINATCTNYAPSDEEVELTLLKYKDLFQEKNREAKI